MATTSMIHVRVDSELKDQAANTLESIGLSVSDAIRVFLKRVVAEQQIPFNLKVPNALTISAMNEADSIIQTQSARFASDPELFNDLKKKSSKQARNSSKNR